MLDRRRIPVRFDGDLAGDLSLSESTDEPTVLCHSVPG